MKKVSHFTRDSLKVIKQYTDDELDARWDDETSFQQEVLRFIYCTVDPIELIEIAAIAGGSAKVGKLGGLRLKSSGVRAGVYDLMLLWRNRGIAFIELKAGSYPSVAQKEFGKYLSVTDHEGSVCRTLREIQFFLQKCGLEFRRISFDGAP